MIYGHRIQERESFVIFYTLLLLIVVFVNIQYKNAKGNSTHIISHAEGINRYTLENMNVDFQFQRMIFSTDLYT